MADFTFDDTSANDVFETQLFFITLADGETAVPESFMTARGTVLVNQDGSIVFVPIDSAINALLEGEQLTDDFFVTINAADGGTRQVLVSATFTGANDEATSIVVTGETAVSEDGQTTATGVITVNDIDAGQNTLPNDTLVGDYGQLVIVNGQYTYTLNNASSAVQSLRGGQMVTDSFTVDSADQTQVADIRIQITGSNDLATILTPNGVEFEASEDSGLIMTSASVTDGDAGQNTFMAEVIEFDGDRFEITADGAITFSFNPANYQSRNDGDSDNFSYVIRSSDGSALTRVFFTINGADEASNGTSGDDNLGYTQFDDDIDGGQGIDTINFSEQGSPVQVNTQTGTITGAGGNDDIVNVENFVLTSGDDSFLGNDADETVTGGMGNDDIETAGGDDVVFADGGDDDVHGGSGAGDDYYDGGAGTGDTVIYSSTTAGVTVDMNAIDRSANGSIATILAGVPLPTNTPVGLAIGSEIGTDAFVNFENVTGGSGDDTLFGDAGDNVLDGGAGNDLLRGNDGDDTLIGGMGTDTIDYSNQTGAVQVNLTDGNVNAGAQGGNDTVSGVENAVLTAGADQFIGNASNNEVTGGLGDDQLNGADGDDTAVFVNTVAQDGLATEVDVVGLHALVLGTLSGDGLDTIQNIENLEFRNGETAPVIIEIVNANAVVSTVADEAELNESELTGPLSTAMGNVLTNDINLDADMDDVKIVTNFGSGFSETSAMAGGTIIGQYGSLTLNANGGYVYTANASTNDLSQDETYTDTFYYNADDGDDGDSNVATLTFTINGIDDAAVITGTTTGSVTEDAMVVDGDIVATGTLTAVDPDQGESGFVVSTMMSEIGSLAIDADGAWTYSIDNNSLTVQSLGAGASITDTFTVETIGGDTETITVTINGVNDNPVAGAVTFAPVPANGVLNVPADSANGTLASALALTGGSLTSNPEIYNSTTVPHITIIAQTDNNPDFYSYNFNNVIITPPNTLFTVDVDGVTGSVPIALTFYYEGSELLTTTVDRFGQWPDSPTFDVPSPGNLPSGQIGTQTPLVLSGNFQVRVGSAASGGTAGLGLGNGYTLHVSLPGGAVLASTPFDGTFEETNAALETSGNVAFTDIDTNDTPQAAYTAATGLSANVTGGAQLTVAQQTALANAFSITEAGAFTFNTPSPDYLGADDVLTLNYTVDITDDHGGSTTQIVTITINGNNDAPVITSTAQTATLTEAVTPATTMLTASGAVTASDVDNGDGPDTQLFNVTGTVLSYTGPGSLTAGQMTVFQSGFVLNDDGTWAYNVASPEYLAAGASVTLTNTVTVSDGNGGTATQDVVVTINGANDAPTVVGPINNIAATIETGNAVNQSVIGGGFVGFGDVDIGNVLTLSKSAATVVYSDAEGNPIDVVASGLMTQAQYDGFVLAVSNAFTVSDTDGSLTDNQATATWAVNYVAPTLDFLSVNENLTATVTITATDAAGLTATANVQMIVYGSNDGPVLTPGSLAPLADTAENTTYAPLTGDLSALANDLDINDTESFSLVGSGATDYGTLTVNANGTYSFAVNSAAVNALQTGDSDTLTFTIRVTDGSGVTSDANFTLAVTGANDNPIAPAISDSIGEDVGVVTAALLIDAFDPDNTDVDFANLSVTVSGDLTVSEIASIQAVLNDPMVTTRNPETGDFVFNTTLFNTLDLNETATITLSYDVVDSNGGSTARTFEIVVEGALEVITAGLDEFDNGPVNGGNFGDLINGLEGDDTLNGGSGDDHVIGGEGDDIVSGGGNDDMIEGNAGDDTLSGGSGNDDIDGGEGNDAIDGGSGSDTINAGSGDNTVNGGSGSDTLELTGDWAEYDITTVGGVVTLTRTVDGEVETVTATNVERFAFGDNGEGYTGMGTAAMLANDGPVIEASTFDVDETPDGLDRQAAEPQDGAVTIGQLIGNVNATDMDLPLGDELSYAITAGNAAGLFTIDSNGDIYLLNALDFETDPTSFVLKIEVTDLQGLTANANVTVNVNDLNDAIGPLTVTLEAPIAENAAVGTLVATAQADDADADDIVSYSFGEGGQTDSGFAIDAVTGAITVADPSRIDFERTHGGQIGLFVEATSTDGTRSSQFVAIEITDAAEPIGPIFSEIGSVAEGIGNDFFWDNVGNKGDATNFDPRVIGGVYVGNVDAGEMLTYALTDDAGGRFEIDAENGLISYTDPLLFDFEASPTHSITIMVTSTDGSSVSQTLEINVDDIFKETLVLTSGDYEVIGGENFDLVDYSGSAGAVFADLSNNMVMETTTTTGTVSAADVVTSTDSVTGFEGIVGSNFGDRFYGGAENNEIYAADGDDYVYGGEGDDVIDGGAGSDLLIGEGGSDTASFAFNVGAVYVDLAYGGTYGIAQETALTEGVVAFATPTLSTDFLFSIENVDGSNFGDRIYGDDAINIINGNDGNDIIYANGGNDVINGGLGNDHIIGGAGMDMMTGGEGADTFWFSTTIEAATIDQITDFTSGTDALWFSREAFDITGADPINLVIDGPAAAANSFIYDSATGNVSFDADGAGGADATVFANVGAGTALLAADIVLYG